LKILANEEEKKKEKTIKLINEKELSFMRGIGHKKSKLIGK
jgi:hypothetical protein